MQARDRFLAALRGHPTDRPPFGLWMHFHDHDATPERLAAATLDFTRRYRPDFVKHTPTGLYAVEDWGTPIRAFPGQNRPPERIRPAFDSPAGWRALSPLNPQTGALGRELRGLMRVRAGLNGDTPLLMTVFSPLTLAYKLTGPRLLDDMRTAPADLHAGLQTIAATAARYVEAVRVAGADGLFFAGQLASAARLSRQAYATFGEPYDRVVLEAWGGAGPVILHLCGADIFFELADRYPVDGVSWDHTASEPSPAAAPAQTGRALVGGIDRAVFLRGPPCRLRKIRFG
ncbi:MAG: uroporphyrinogen decarboxylase family protein, partial [Anaerolineae bacterium]